MKPRHAALALLVWYVISPPIRNGVPQNVPIAQWDKRGSYDSREACDRQLEEASRTHVLDKPKYRAALPTLIAEFLSLECIASDDPRLAK